MKKILIAAHGHFASGVKSTLELIFGEQKEITVIDCYVDEEQPKDKIGRYMSSLKEEDEVIICTDIVGGSVNQLMIPYAMRPNTYLVSGVNVAFMVELTLAPAISAAGTLRDIIERAKNQLVFVTEAVKKEEDSSL